ncbi:segregation/condensation protein A (plasmid) [Pontibacillus sp. ALD_SL1]|uniref:segregation and condensation protein A n=1 Tax=Pontibacillus sp. ALD_SL1 TaxID=2777185 RepID=UPI001A977C36|nr:segregation/condensation protein A [Pontibacillus sp. ALD_SL1]QST02341.1 segregation/condensation protein A [Pontibacillus sp. ALD_SL1]
MDYIIRTDGYEGPLDLLLELIKKRKMDIKQLRISEITQDYLDTLQQMEKANMELASEFTEMASLLLDIKCKSLLHDEKKDESKDELIKQLEDYQRYKESVQLMKQLKDVEERHFKRTFVTPVTKRKPVCVSDLVRQYQTFMESALPSVSPLDRMDEERRRIPYTLEGELENWKKAIDNQNTPFLPYLRSLKEREQVIMAFGALLELIKSNMVLIKKEGNAIVIIKNKEV